MTLESAITFFIAVFIFGITPGPGIFAILSRSMVYGAKSCLFLTLGMVVSDICYLVMACLGLATLAEKWESVFFLVRILGACYLLYLGWKMWTSNANLSAEIASSAEENPYYKKQKLAVLADFFQGLMISGSNPKVILFYIAFLPTFMDVTQLSSGDITLAAVLTFFALMIGVMLVAFMSSQARRYLRSPRSVKILNRTAGSIMASAGLYIGLKG